jgi:hypothetical protein
MLCAVPEILDRTTSVGRHSREHHSLLAFYNCERFLLRIHNLQVEGQRDHWREMQEASADNYDINIRGQRGLVGIWAGIVFR